MEAEDFATEDFPRTVTDSRGAIYRLENLIGRGGQGAVFTTVDGTLAVKLIRGEREAVGGAIDRVRSLPFGDRSIARPLAVLEEQDGVSGYVMGLLADMMALWKLFSCDRFDTDEEFLNWYNHETGGLRRRLVLLGRAAEILAWLHGYGLVFADPSPNNILISSSLDNDQVWLIDPDNIGVSEADKGDVPRHTGTPVAQTVGTPSFKAPEVVKGGPVTTLSDAWGLAEITFQALTGLHPLIGDLVNDAPLEEQEKAFAGAYPWIDDINDASNRASWGIDRDWVLTKGLKRIAQETFGPGKLEPLLRPGAGRWAELLLEASDLTLPCPKCQATYYAGTFDRCPWPDCNAPRPACGRMGVMRWTAEYEEPAFHTVSPAGFPPRQEWSSYAYIPESGYTFTARLAYNATGPRGHDPVLLLNYQPDGILATPMTTQPIFVARPAITDHPMAFVELAGPQLLRWQELANGSARIRWIHFGPAEQAHYAIRIDRINEVAE